MIRRTTLVELDRAAQAQAANAVYADYVVPVHFDEAQLEQHVRCHDIALDQSPLWLDEAGEVVALGLLGLRGDRGWVGGFGVAKSRRGEGLGRELAREMLAVARHAGVTRLQLEVLTQNLAAIRTYERSGFARTRDLRIMSRAAGAPETGGATCDVVDADAAALLEVVIARPESPCWQRSVPSLRRFEGLTGLVLGSPDAPRALAIVRATPEEVRIGDLAARDPHDLAAMAQAVVARYPGRRFIILNEPEASPLCAVLEALGFQDTLRQHEMAVSLA